MNYEQDRANKLVKTFTTANTFVHELHTIVQSILTQLEAEILLGDDRCQRILTNALKIQALEDIAQQDTTPPPPAAESDDPLPPPAIDWGLFGNSPASVLIARLKKEEGISPTGLAIICGVHVSSITNWSNSKPIREVNYNRLIEICHVFNTPTTGDTP